jgi:CRP-like cAMP-binding protein
MMSDEVVFDLLRRVPLFGRVPAAELQEAAKATRAFTKRKGASIFDEGSPADSCYVVTAGRAKVVLSAQGGNEIILGTVEPFELVGELALLDSSPRSAGLTAMEDCQLLRMPKASFDALRANRAFDERLLLHVAAMLRRATEQLRAIYAYGSAERVCWCLARLAARGGRHAGGAVVISPRPPHQEIAEMTGCTRETVTRVLLQLKRLKRVSWDRDSVKLNEAAFRGYLEAAGTPAPPGDVARIV